MTPGELTRIFPRCPDPQAWSRAITEAWWRWGFVTPESQAGYLGICGNETGGFVQVKSENLNYSLARAKEIFSKARTHPDIASDRIGKGQQAFANWIYAGIIGNGDEASGDGWKFRGRGVIQLTGRANYLACGEALGVNLTADPDALLRDPETSAAAAAWFMAKYAKILPLLNSPNEADFLEGARKVGWTDQTATTRRLAYRRTALAVLGAGQAGAGPADVARPVPSPPSPRKGGLDGIVAALLRMFRRA